MSDEMLKLDELELLIREYDPEQSDWNFRKSVMMKIIEQIRPAIVRAAAASAEPVALVPVHPRHGPLWSDTYASGSQVARSDHYERLALYTHPAPDAEIE